MKQHRPTFGIAAATAMLSFTIFFLPTVIPSARCQDTSTGDPVKKALQAEKDKTDLQKAIADNKKAIAQDQADTLKSELSISTDKLPQGTATLNDKVAIEGIIVAYRSASITADKLAQLIVTANASTDSSSHKSPNTAAQQPSSSTATVDASKCPGAVYVFFDPKVGTDIWAVTVLKQQLKTITSQGKSLLQPADRDFAAAAVGPAIDAAMTLLALFKTDTTVQGVTLTGDDLAFQALLADALQRVCNGVVIYQPAYYIGTIVEGDGSTTALLADLVSTRNSVAAAIASSQGQVDSDAKAIAAAQKELEQLKSTREDIQKQIATLEKQLAHPPPPPAKAKTLKQSIEKMKVDLADNEKAAAAANGTVAARKASTDAQSAFVVKAKAFVDSVDSLNAALGKADDSGYGLLNRLLRAESLATRAGANARFIAVRFVSLGANNITKKNFFSTSISFSGGNVAAYYLMDNVGVVLKAGTLYTYGKRVSLKHVNDKLPTD
jgi:hypothetical protein